MATGLLTQLVISQCSFVPRGYEILWSLSYWSTRYCRMAPLSQIFRLLPLPSLSTTAGMRPLGLISKYHCSFCSCSKRFTGRICRHRVRLLLFPSKVCEYHHCSSDLTLYSKPNSSRAIETLSGFGVPSQ